MSYEIKQSSTEAALLFFMTLASDHVSAATGLSPTVTISKNGAAFASPSGAVSEIANGWYKVAANATDTNTLGPIALHAAVATADNCDLIAASVVAYDPQDSKLGLFSKVLTEAAAAVGSAPTLEQLLYSVFARSFPSKRSASGTTETVTKADGSTALATFTYDTANPTSITRAT